MPLPTEITVAQLSRLVGLPQTPRLVDVRADADIAADPRLIPGATHVAADAVSAWAATSPVERFIVVCRDGAALSQGVAAQLRHQGLAAETLEGGFAAWRHARQPLVTTAALPRRDDRRRTVWVTRARPKIDRIACPWLIRRFVDPDAVVLFVAAAEVAAVAERFDAAPFDIDGVFFSHRGEACSFDTMLDAFGLDIAALRHVAKIVRGADTARLDVAPEAAGLLAVSLGLSRMYRDDIEQLAAGMTIYDGLYRWARDATDETHNWPSNQQGA